MRLVATLLGLSLLVSSGAGSHILFICGMGDVVSLGCHCPHMDDQDATGAVHASCCQASELNGPPGSVRASSQGNGWERPILLNRVDADPILSVRASPLRLTTDWRAPLRAGPPIFLEVCSYLI